MRAVRFHEYGGADVLRVEDVDRPVPGPDELLVEVRGAGVNPTDTHEREASTRRVDLPRIPGSDFAGVVAATGDGVAAYGKGDRVFGTGLYLERQGAYAEYAVAPTHRVAALPGSVPFAVGAGLGVVGVTAWQALFPHGRLEPADVCLVHGGSGGVGHVAVQLASLAGATVVATAGDAEKRERVRELGADAVVDYRLDHDDLRDAVLDAAGRRPDVVLDHRVGEYLEFDLDVVGREGRVVVVGDPGDSCRFGNVTAAIHKEAEIHLMALRNTPDMSVVLADLAELAARGDLTVAVARTYDLDGAAEAQRAVIEDSFVGKLVIEP